MSGRSIVSWRQRWGRLHAPRRGDRLPAKAVSSLAGFDHPTPAAWTAADRPPRRHSSQAATREPPFHDGLLPIVLTPPRGASHRRHEQAQWIVRLVTEPTQFFHKRFSLQSVTL